MNISADFAWRLSELGESNDAEQFENIGCFESLVGWIMKYVVETSLKGDSFIEVKWNPLDIPLTGRVVEFLEQLGYEVVSWQENEDEGIIVSWEQ